MQIQVSTRHGDLSGTTQEAITNKVAKLTRILDRLSSIEVTVDLQREGEPAVEVLVSAEHKHDFVAAGSSDDIMTALDGVIPKLEQQLRKYKDKIQEH